MGIRRVERSERQLKEMTGSREMEDEKDRKVWARMDAKKKRKKKKKKNPVKGILEQQGY